MSAHDEELEAIRTQLGALLDAAGGPLRRLSISAGSSSVELEWPTAPDPTDPAPAQTGAARSPGAGTSGTAGAAGDAGTAGVGGGGAAGAAGAGARTPGAAAGGPDADTVADAGAVHEVRAPMVGTFYHAPEPGATPFVRPGDRVEKGDQVGILEAMKLMTAVEADASGTVVALPAPDGEPVEYDQPLVTLDTGGAP